MLGLLLLLGVAGGEARLGAIDAPARLVRDGRPLAGRAYALGHPRPGPFGSSVEVQVAGGRLHGARLLARVPRWRRWPPRLPIGGEVRVRGTLRRLGGSGFERYLRRRGVAGELLVDAVAATGARRGGLTGTVDRLRERSEHSVAAGLPAHEAALERGMVLGQDEAIAEPTRDAFRASGLAHLLAVSGQNVMLLVALALPGLAAAGLGVRARAAALLGLIAVYVPLAGAGLSLQRAGVMGAAGIAALAASRPASRSYALLLAAAATLALNPRGASDPGWQLSFAAVAGILWIAPLLRRTLRTAAEALGPPSGEAAELRGAAVEAPGPRGGEVAGLRGPAVEALGQAGGPAAALSATAEALEPPGGAGAGVLGSARGDAFAGGGGARRVSRRTARAGLAALADGAALTVAATVATAPLLAYHFGAVPLAGLPANLLALPAVAPAMWLGMIKAGVGQVAALGGVGQSAAEALAGLLGALTRPPVAYIDWLAERFAQLPGGRLAVPLGSTLGVALAYAALVGAVLALRRVGGALAPHAQAALAAWRRLRPSRRPALIVLVVAGLFLVASPSLAPPSWPGHLTVRFLDVGQGDATLVQHPDGTAILFDGGPPEAHVATLLQRLGVRRLALVVATHQSRDHHGGLREVLDRLPVGLLLDGGDGTTDPTYRDVLAEARRLGVRRVTGIAPLTLQVGAVRVRVLSPPPRPPGPAPEDPNPRAVVAVVSSGGFDLFLSADAESDALAPLPLADVDAMKVPHHGSSDPGLPELLRRLRPELAAIEVGRHNTYGHPAPSTLAALAHDGVPTYRTDRDGTVTLTVGGSGARVSTAR